MSRRILLISYWFPPAVGAASAKEMGKVMGQVMGKLKATGKLFDGGAVNQLVKSKLT